MSNIKKIEVKRDWLLYTINMIAIILVLIAVMYAAISFNETKKARQDILLPVVIPVGIHFDNTGDQIGVDIMNVGKGLAFNIEISLVDFTKNKKVRWLNVGVTERWAIKQPAEEDLREIEAFKERKKIVVVVTYEDVFHRKLSTECYGQYKEKTYGEKTYSILDFNVNEFIFNPP